MYRFLLTRAIGLVIVLLGTTFITFLVGHFSPYDPIRAMMGIKSVTDPSLYHQLKHEYGLDLSWWQQYYMFLTNALHGNFGYSYHYISRPAWDLIEDGVGVSVELGLEVLAVTLVIGIPLGILSALRVNTHSDTAITTATMLFYTFPDITLIVLFQILMIWLYQNSLPSLPVAGWSGWEARIGPVLITATTGVGYFSRLTRATVLEVAQQDFVRTARAKGMQERVVIWMHMLRYACIPLLTVIGPSLAFIVTGLYITENFFNIPGIGYLTIQATVDLDFPVLQATTILFSTSVVFFNALTDIAYGLADPRIRVE